jgi:uncharacterized protein involved in oxidation of intracellular sulfur
MNQTVLLILGSAPYDGSDRVWNALRLAGQLHTDGLTVRLFLMNDAVDLARNGIGPPEGYFDLVKMTQDLIVGGVPVKVCGTCQARCGIRKGQPYYTGAEKSSMADLSEWIRASDQVLTF